MKIYLHKNFRKQYKQAPKIVQIKYHERRNLFARDPFNAILHNHALKGEYAGYWSINITGDWRVVYYKMGDDTVVFTKIGTHSQLYG